VLVREPRSQAPERFPLCAGQRNGAHLLDQRYGRQQDAARAQFVRDRVREHHPLGRLQGKRHQPVDQLPEITSIELPKLEPLEEFLEVLAPGLIALCVLRPGSRSHFQLRGDDAE